MTWISKALLALEYSAGRLTAVNHFENEQFENALFETTTLNYAQFDIDYWYIWWFDLFETQTFCHIFTLRNLLFAKCADWESTILRHAHFAEVPSWDMFTLLQCLFYHRNKLNKLNWLTTQSTCKYLKYIFCADTYLVFRIFI